MNSIYDSKYHLHLGYYEQGNDFEAIAYKKNQTNIWDVFFDFEMYNLKIPEKYKDQYYEKYGVKIFSICTDDLDYTLGSNEFKKWLIQLKIIQVDSF
ncbi:DUF3986 family protein [Bacillus sp. WLY-B-L8]|uniref:DUF3986 family protein n=1 Tax=Bacillus multifaciens TaxID=3068506 RepID=UPI00274044F7|nr:DUF3986 family protein [Bacillus sp. WLY-B-L8]MDP7981533.1 DUF3986 family protein [Bacillus sp. WLY-B-L8]